MSAFVRRLSNSLSIKSPENLALLHHLTFNLLLSCFKFPYFHAHYYSEKIKGILLEGYVFRVSFPTSRLACFQVIEKF